MTEGAAEPGSPAGAVRELPLWRKLLPVAVGAALVGWVLTRIDFDAFLAALRATNHLAFLGFTVLFTGALLTTDTFATARVYRMTVADVRFRDLLVIRAASYLPSVINHHIGQAWLAYFLSRAYSAPLWRVAGATLLVYATVFGNVCLLGAAALPWNPGHARWLVPTLAVLGVAALGYLLVLRLRPKVLADRAMAAPLFDAGVKGHFVALGYRVPHVVVLFIGTWVPFLFFGVDIPFSDALALVPPLMVVVALPISPQGVGTRDLFALQLFAQFAHGTTEERAAAVAAATVSWAGVLTVVPLLFSPFFYRAAQRLLERAPAAD